MLGVAATAIGAAVGDRDAVSMHCNISRCETDGSYCTEAADQEHLVWITTIIFVPVLVALLGPMVARNNRGICTRDDDSPDINYDAIDPPMFLCGVGLLSLDCGLSGLLTINFCALFAFVITFYSLLLSDHPCTTALGECQTISCVCGNVIREGYAFMFALLLLTSSILVQRFSRMVQHHRVQHRMLKPTLILGSLLLTLTGIFPERYDQSGTMGGFLRVMYAAHMVGIGGGCLLLLWVPYLWFVEHWWTHRAQVPLRSLFARTCYFLSALAYFILLYSGEPGLEDFNVQYCTMLKSQAECEAWPVLNQTACAQAQACIQGSDASVCAGMVQPNFRCRWSRTDSFTSWTRLIAPPDYIDDNSCIRAECPLEAYSQGVAVEFGLLLLVLTYVASFALHDVRRLLDRPPPHAEESKADLAHIGPALTFEQPGSALLAAQHPTGNAAAP